MKTKITEYINNLEEHGDMHSDGCCVNTEDGCDAGTNEMECCDNMKFLKKVAIDVFRLTAEFISHDMKLDSEEQRKMVVKMYVEMLEEDLK